MTKVQVGQPLQLMRNQLTGGTELRFDPHEAIAHLRSADRDLRKVIDKVGPFTLQPQRMTQPFEVLAKAIVYQQLSGRAAATIYGRLNDLFPKRRKLHASDILTASDEVLRSAGLSRAKVAALRDLSAKTVSGEVPSLRALHGMSEEEIIERLITIRGIGQWTVEMLLIFRLGRPDVMPATDLGVRKGFQLTYKTAELPKPKEIITHAERWRPYRSVGSWYMWRAVELYA